MMQGKDEIALDFAIDDTTGGEHEDALVGLSFHVPKEATGFPGMDEDTPSLSVSLPPFLHQLQCSAALDKSSTIHTPVCSAESKGKS